MALGVGSGIGRVDMFLKLEGVPGESKDEKLTDHIEVLSFAWGVSQQGTYGQGMGGGAGKAEISDVQFSHYFDKASSVLLQMCVSGKHISKGEFIARRAGADGKPQNYLNLKFDDIIVTGVSTSGSGHGDTRMMENFSLNFRKFEVVYTTQDAKGAGQPSNPVKWDLQKNAEA
jgi:type VI secretion system secreted protein Hcp